MALHPLKPGANTKTTSQPPSEAHILSLNSHGNAWRPELLVKRGIQWFKKDQALAHSQTANLLIWDLKADA